MLAFQPVAPHADLMEYYSHLLMQPMPGNFVSGNI